MTYDEAIMIRPSGGLEAFEALAILELYPGPSSLLKINELKKFFDTHTHTRSKRMRTENLFPDLDLKRLRG
jgi:hypothetical protein